MFTDRYDVIVIGTGASGLMAAIELTTAGKKVAIVEASSRAGGRIMSFNYLNSGVPVELGAEFIHGHLPLTFSLLKKAGVPYYKTEGSMWQKTLQGWHRQGEMIEDFQDLERKIKGIPGDITVQHFLDKYIDGDDYKDLRQTLKQYVEGYYAGDTAKASLMALYNELTTGDDEAYRMEGGYGRLVDWMEKEIKSRNGTCFFSQAVKAISFEGNEIIIHGKSKSFSADKVLVTVSVGVLAAGAIEFPASFQHKKQALEQLGFGGVIKIVVQFTQPIWKEKKQTGGKNLDDLLFLFSDQEVRTWWTQHPKEDALLIGWISGPAAKRLSTASDAALKEKALLSLTHIFDCNMQTMTEKIQSVYLHNWVTDPHFYGGYSYDVVDGKKWKAVLKEPIENKLFFAGEGLHDGPEIGTVEAALLTGKEAAQKILASF